jgi:hypothetical protein
MSFTQAEIDYLASQPLARLATVGADGQPDVVPVAFEFDVTGFWIGGPGGAVLSTKQVRSVVAGRTDGARSSSATSCPSTPWLPAASACTAWRRRSSSASARSVPAATYASRRRCRGAGTGKASRRATSGYPSRRIVHGGA